ncbi:DUF5777 family beta-barrel protein [Rubrivirga sp. IMCC43871]|uniref:DUF5777 family beta-barrel protein n=1 Tax=Rubrivirga sp. IMCC43871 TaxID=3391575 RepID=UPI00398FF94B
MTRLVALALAAALAVPAAGQPARVRVAADRPAEVFWAPSVITTPSVTMLPARNLNVTIFHAFAPVSQGAGGLFGLDGPANIRFGLDAGLTDWLTVGVGRTRFDKLIDARVKGAVLRQTERGTVPVSVVFAGNAALATEPDGRDLVAGLSYAGSVLVARRFGDALSIQVAPTVAHFNTVYEQVVDGTVETPENTLVAVALGAQLRLSRGSALLAEYVPVLSARSDGTTNALGVGVALDTGGHVFQLFVTASPWATTQHTIGQTVDRALDGDVRLGFTVNRVFGR